MDQPIVGYLRDDVGDWVARLACGHLQHLRHEPPWLDRPWITTEEGRAARLGVKLACKKCDEGRPADGVEEEGDGGEEGNRE